MEKYKEFHHCCYSEAKITKTVLTSFALAHLGRNYKYWHIFLLFYLNLFPSLFILRERDRWKPPTHFQAFALNQRKCSVLIIESKLCILLLFLLLL